VTRAQLDELLASVRALRADNARLESRLEKLEREATLAGASGGGRSVRPEPPPNTGHESSLDALPPLTVVKLKPRREAAPRLATEVAVTEPPQGVVEELRAPSTTVEPADDPTDLAIADAQFDRALDALKTGNAEGGVQAMQRFIVEWPKHPRADNALYFAGLGLMSEGDLEAAASSFQRVTAEYPAGDAVVDSMLKLAECRMKLKQPQAARSTWEHIVQSYPGTAAAAQAQARLTSHSAASTATP
jgi:tol-pal system protein YbgF